MNIPLNRQQTAAITASDGPLMIIAGAGTGKTTTLIHRLLYLLNEKAVPPDKLLAITFTVRAAREMRQRLDALSGNAAALEPVWIGTIHALCHEILRNSGALDGRTLISQSDRAALIREVLKDPSFPGPAVTAKQFDSLITIEKSAAVPREHLSPACRRYQETLEERGLLDFDDLILCALHRIAAAPEIAEALQRRFTHICVDEYQDVNRAQYLLLRLLCPAGSNLCVVGDADQAIYAFRGAQVENFLSFQQDFPRTTVVPLTANYRSTATILDAARAVVRNNRARIAIELTATRPPGHPLERWELPDDNAEAMFIAREIERLLGGVHFETLSAQLDDLPACCPQDIAVLYRLHQQGGLIKKALQQRGIPVRVAASRSFYDEPRVAAVLRMLELITDPGCDHALAGLLNDGPLAIGAGSLEILRRAAQNGKTGLHQALHTAQLPAAARGKIAAMEQALAAFRERATAQTIETITRDIWLMFFPGTTTPDDTLFELLTCVIPYAHVPAAAGIPQFLEKVALMQESDADFSATEAVTLLTVHASKGLEFPVVFLTGLEEGLFPYIHESETAEMRVEEERRLFYVGMTRARDRLYLTATRSRFLFGTRRAMQPSSFLSEIPDHYLLKKEYGRPHKKERPKQMKLFA